MCDACKGMEQVGMFLTTSRSRAVADVGLMLDAFWNSGGPDRSDEHDTRAKTEEAIRTLPTERLIVATDLLSKLVGALVSIANGIHHVARQHGKNVVQDDKSPEETVARLMADGRNPLEVLREVEQVATLVSMCENVRSVIAYIGVSLVANGAQPISPTGGDDMQIEVHHGPPPDGFGVESGLRGDDGDDFMRRLARDLDKTIGNGKRKKLPPS